MNLRQNRQTVDQLFGRRGELCALAEAIRRTPEANAIHGMYVVALRKLMESRGIRPDRLQKAHHFRYYPLRDFMRLLLDCAVRLYADVPLREGLRTLGQLVIPTFANSLAGKVLMSAIGKDWEIALSCLARGYQVSLRPGKARVAESRPGQARVELRQIWNYGDSYQVGVVQGLMNWCQIDGRITPRVLSACDTDLVVEWQVH